jgi:hypothetical protein
VTSHTEAKRRKRRSASFPLFTIFLLQLKCIGFRGKPEGERTLGISKREWENGIKMGLRQGKFYFETFSETQRVT